MALRCCSCSGGNTLDDLLTTRQLEQLLQVDRITIYRMLGDGRLRGLKVGGQWRFPRAEVDDWLRGRYPEASSDGEATTASGPAEPLPLSCIQAIQAVFAEARDVGAVTTGPDGSPLTKVSNSCAFCTLVLSTDEGQARCAASWRQAGEAPGPCHTGLLCAAAPVRVEGREVARAVACQFVTQDHAADGADWTGGLPELAADLGLDEVHLKRAAAEVHDLPKPDLPKIRPLLHSVAATYAEIGRERLKLLTRLQRIAEITALND